MRRLLLVIGIALVAAAAGATAAPAANLANVRAVLPFAISNPCTGEGVVGEIRVHFVLNFTTNGNRVSGMELLQYSVKGVGQTTERSTPGTSRVMPRSQPTCSTGRRR